MTVIAWDGDTLAADKRGMFAGLARTVTKIFRVNDFLVGVSGNAAEGYDMVEWLRAGCDTDKFPPSQRDKDSWASCVAISRERIKLYERAPSPIIIEDRFFAIGSGRDYALAAMHCGKSAREAVEIACLFECGCGNGVDVLQLGLA